MLDKALDHVDQAQLARLPVDDGQHDHAEVGLQLRVLVKIVENDVGLLAALQLEHDAHAVAVAFIANFGDALDFLFVDQRGGGLNQPRFVYLIRNLGDDDGFAVLADLLGEGLGPHFDAAAAAGEIVENTRPAQDVASGGKIRTLHDLHQLRKRGVGALHQLDSGVDNLRQIVRGNVSRHAHRDARGAVDQQVGDAGRENFGFLPALVEIGSEIDGLFVDIFEQRRIHARKARFGVPVGCRRIAIHRAEVSLPVDQWIAQREGLRHADQGVINRGVSVRVIVSQHLADDARAFAVSAVEGQAHFRHGKQDAAVHGFQAVANVGQSAADDHAHRVVEIRPAHLVFDVYVDDVLVAAVTPQGKLRATAGRRWSGREIGIVCQRLTP